MRSLGRCICVLGIIVAGCDYDWTVQPKESSSSSSSGAVSIACESNKNCDQSSYCRWGDGLCGGGAVGNCEPIPKVSTCPEKGPVCGCDKSTGADPCVLATNGVDIANCK